MLTEAICYLTANTHYKLGTLIPECNGVSQFRQDTDESSIHVREFNLAWHVRQPNQAETPPSTPRIEPRPARALSPLA